MMLHIQKGYNWKTAIISLKMLNQQLLLNKETAVRISIVGYKIKVNTDIENMNLGAASILQTAEKRIAVLSRI